MVEATYAMYIHTYPTNAVFKNRVEDLRGCADMYLGLTGKSNLLNLSLYNTPDPQVSVPIPCNLRTLPHRTDAEFWYEVCTPTDRSNEPAVFIGTRYRFYYLILDTYTSSYTSPLIEKATNHPIPSTRTSILINTIPSQILISKKIRRSIIKSN